MLYIYGHPSIGGTSGGARPHRGRSAFFTDADHRYAKELKSLAVELGVADRIRFTEVRTNTLSLLRSVDMVVFYDGLRDGPESRTTTLFRWETPSACQSR